MLSPAELKAKYGIEGPIRPNPKGPHPPEHIEGKCGYCVPKNVPSGGMSPTDVPRAGGGEVPQPCPQCLTRSVVPGRQLCDACRKAAQRAKR